MLLVLQQVHELVGQHELGRQVAPSQGRREPYREGHRRVAHDEEGRLLRHVETGHLLAHDAEVLLDERPVRRPQTDRRQAVLVGGEVFGIALGLDYLRDHRAHLVLGDDARIDGPTRANATGDLDRPDDRVEGVVPELPVCDDRVRAAESKDKDESEMRPRGKGTTAQLRRPHQERAEVRKNQLPGEEAGVVEPADQSAPIRTNAKAVRLTARLRAPSDRPPARGRNRSTRSA